MTNSELKDRLSNAIALMWIPGVGPQRYQKLVVRFGSAEGALQAPVSQLAQVEGISSGLAEKITSEVDLESARQMAVRVVQLGWEVLFVEDEEYPASLKSTSSAPPLLFRSGLRLETKEKLVAIVGTRHATEQGFAFARQLGRSLAEAGVTVVSGMAEGIDSAAHRGALEAGGRTVAVWGSSLEIVFPSSNRGLADEIQRQGAVYSEYLPGTHPDKTTFPQRNRIISGLADGVVVVEAGKRSGALITAGYALEQGRELMAVPGAPYNRNSEGCNELIKQGAGLVTGVDDVFTALPHLKGEVRAKALAERPDMTKTEKTIVELLASGPTHIDQVSRAASLGVSELMELLLALELKGVLRELPGKRYVLTDDYL